MGLERIVLPGGDNSYRMRERPNYVYKLSAQV